MGVIEPYKPIAVTIMQGEGIAQTVRTLRSRRYTSNLEFEPVALFKMMDAAIERQQKLKRVFVGYDASSLYLLS